MKDIEIYREVRSEALAGAGGMLAVQQVFGMLDKLADAYGERFTIDGACSALTTLAKMAELAKAELQQAKAKVQP